MSGQWEVVGKKKEKASKVPVPKSNKETGKKKLEVPRVKLVEVLDITQVKNLYAKEKSKEVNKNVEKKVPEANKNKPPKKEKVPEAPKPKAPKSIESALNSIDADEFKSVFEKSKTQFPDAPIVWLKELAQYLNQRVTLEIQDPVFTSRPSNYPLCVVPPSLKAVIENAAVDAKQGNNQLFFDIAITAMATDMAKNLPAIGHKLFLQYIATTKPTLIVENLSKHIVLRNSYQNRPNIGLSILWAVGQAGLGDSQVGLQVFEQLMLPLIELKNYSRFIVKYLLDWIKGAENALLSREQYLLILDTIFSNKKNFPSDMKPDLVVAVAKLKTALFVKNASTSDLLDFYLRKIASNSQKAYQDILCDVLVECFSRDPKNLESWSKNYAKNVPSSAILLKYIETNWKSIGSRINRRAFTSAIREIALVNNELLLKKRREDGLNEAVTTMRSLSQKMESKKKSGSSFRLLFILISLSVASFICYDIKQEGSWQNSRTRRTLKDSGACEYAHKGFDKVKQGLSWADGHIESNFPGYQKTILEFAEPHIELARNLGIIFYNLASNIKDVAVEKYPIIVQSVDSYAPGLVEHSQNAVHNVWSTSVLYVNRSIDYLKKEVFVGQLSPENMQRVVIEAFNTTQIKATEYYHWLYEKVQTTIK